MGSFTKPARLFTRRQALGALGALGTAGLLGCQRPTPSPVATGAIGCVLIPEETEGPYPLDLSADIAYFRKNISEGRPGIPLSLTLSLVNISNRCTPLRNARVDIWHCDKDGIYSGVEQPGHNTVGQTFCRGIMLSNQQGQVTFHTIYPGWYEGRVTHIHFRVYLNNGLVATSQLAFPETITRTVYESEAYRQRGQNTSIAKNADDMVFGDGDQYQLLTLTPAQQGGYDGTLTVGIAV